MAKNRLPRGGPESGVRSPDWSGVRTGPESGVRSPDSGVQTGPESGLRGPAGWCVVDRVSPSPESRIQSPGSGKKNVRVQNPESGVREQKKHREWAAESRIQNPEIEPHTSWERRGRGRRGGEGGDLARDSTSTHLIPMRSRSHELPNPESRVRGAKKTTPKSESPESRVRGAKKKTPKSESPESRVQVRKKHPNKLESRIQSPGCGKKTQKR